jgi:protein-disulfide isomerase
MGIDIKISYNFLNIAPSTSKGQKGEFLVKRILTTVGLMLIAAQSFAFNKPALESHLRGMLGLDGRTPIEVGDATPANFAGLLAVPVTIGGGTYMVYMSTDESKYLWGNLNDLTVNPDKSRMDKINLTNAWSKGSKTAPVTIVEYTDLQCPYCSRAHISLNTELYKKYTKDQVRVVFKHYPLPMHSWAETAAVAAECAGAQSGQEGFWKMVDYFFVNQGSFTKTNVNDMIIAQAKRQHLNMPKLDACLSSSEPLSRVRANKEEGSELGVSSTPTLYINGRQRRGFSRFEDISSVIDDKLAEAKSKK